MAVTNLPSRDKFLERNITFHTDHDPTAECSICYEKLDFQTHAPMGFKGPGTCDHVFGASCIYIWLVSGQPGANTCPLCRTILFRPEDNGSAGDSESAVNLEEDEDEADQYLGARLFDNLHASHPANLMIDLTSWYQATLFLNSFWQKLERLAFSEWVPHQEEIEECILQAAEKMRTGYIVRKADIPQFIGVAKKIMWRQAKLGEGFKLKGEEMRKWVERMVKAGLWRIV